MELNEEQYERIAQALDGRQVELTDEERQTMACIVRDEDWFGRTAHAAAPARAMGKAAASIRVALHGRTRIVRIIANVSAAAAIAAVLVLGIMMLIDLGRPVPVAPGSQGIPVAQLEKFIQPGEHQAPIKLLSMDLDRFEADVALMNMPESQASPVKNKLDSLENELDDFLLKNS
ncbi:MAG: hypothetical protein HZA50_15195 [Planctomycetes bacterium]|nr:hypothetical protein [Planctomycetota bacterium]